MTLLGQIHAQLVDERGLTDSGDPCDSATERPYPSGEAS